MTEDMLLEELQKMESSKNIVVRFVLCRALIRLNLNEGIEYDLVNLLQVAETGDKIPEGMKTNLRRAIQRFQNTLALAAQFPPDPDQVAPPSQH